MANQIFTGKVSEGIVLRRYIVRNKAKISDKSILEKGLAISNNTSIQSANIFDALLISPFAENRVFGLPVYLNTSLEEVRDSLMREQSLSKEVFKDDVRPDDYIEMAAHIPMELLLSDKMKIYANSAFMRRGGNRHTELKIVLDNENFYFRTINQIESLDNILKNRFNDEGFLTDLRGEYYLNPVPDVSEYAKELYIFRLDENSKWKMNTYQELKDRYNNELNNLTGGIK